jgi:two-component system sensor histidine kinase UhpB
MRNPGASSKGREGMALRSKEPVSGQENSCVGFIVVAGDGNIVSCSDAAGLVLGYPAAKLLDLPVATLGLPDSLTSNCHGDSASTAASIGAAEPGNRTSRLDAIHVVTGQHRDGHPIAVCVSSASLPDCKGPSTLLLVQPAGTEAQTGRTQALRELASYQEHSREQERIRLARDLHDELGGLLSGLRAQLSMAQAGQPFDATAACRLADDAIDSLRRVVSDLRPGILDQFGLWDALEWYAEQWAGRQSMPTAISVSIGPSCLAVTLDDAHTTAIFRIVQEALTNVSRHAQAASVAISAQCSGGALVVSVADDGCGLPATASKAGSCWGIVGMRERALALGGELTVRNNAGRGAVLELTLPAEEGADG